VIDNALLYFADKTTSLTLLVAIKKIFEHNPVSRKFTVFLISLNSAVKISAFFSEVLLFYLSTLSVL
jgi:hypothetical protein